MGQTYSTITEAYHGGLCELLDHGNKVPSVTDPTSIASNFGKGDRPAIEVLGHQFKVTKCIPTIITSPARRANVPYYVGLLLWTLAGADSVDWLTYYDKNAIKFSHDGAKLCGAFGKRLRALDGTDQLQNIFERLNGDPASRRAVGLLLTSADGATPTFDYPCAIAVQYFIRNGKLDGIVYMRAQQALTVLPFDAFLFMGVQSFLAAKLGIGCGDYIHIAGTFHFYENEKALAIEVISGLDGTPMGEIDHLSTAFIELLQIEESLRSLVATNDVQKIREYQKRRPMSSVFCENARTILLAYASHRVGLDPIEALQNSTASDEVKRLVKEHQKWF